MYTRQRSPDAFGRRPVVRGADEWVTYASLLRARDALVVAIANQELAPAFDAEPPTQRIGVTKP